jgi:hypothetical protein
MRSRETVCIGIPHDGRIDTELALNLVTLMRERKSRIDSMQLVKGVGLLTRTRNLIVKNFLDDTNADWLLMVDSDQTLPLDVFDKLVDTAHKEDKPFVAGLVFAAFFENEVLRPVPAIYSGDTIDQLFPIDDYPKDTVIPIGASGTGCILIHRRVLEAMRENANPNQGTDWCWFFDGALAGRWFSEDLLFCRKVASLGFAMFAHTGAILAHKKDFWLDDRHHGEWKSKAH